MRETTKYIKNKIKTQIKKRIRISTIWCHFNKRIITAYKNNEFKEGICKHNILFKAIELTYVLMTISSR